MISMLLTLPRWVYAVIAALVVVIGAYLYGHHNGWYERDAEMQTEIARQNEAARKTEQELTAQINQNATRLQEANNVINQKQTSLDRAIRAGRVRLPAAGCFQSPASSAPAAGDRDEAGSEPNRQTDKPSDSERATLAAIAEIVAQGDRNTAQLNACIDAYEAIRSQLNAQR